MILQMCTRYITSTINGCRSQQQFQITVDQVALDALLTGYPNFGSVVIIDSLSCNSPTLNLQCTAVGNGTADWISGGLPTGKHA